VKQIAIIGVCALTVFVAQSLGYNVTLLALAFALILIVHLDWKLNEAKDDIRAMSDRIDDLEKHIDNLHAEVDRL
jgi:cell division protein FtsL